MAPSSSIRCWCGQRPGDKNAIVGCSMCSREIHYGCLGVTTAELDEIVNDRPSKYFCKDCAPKLTAQMKKDYAKVSRSGLVFYFHDSDSVDANSENDSRALMLSDVQNLIATTVPAIVDSIMEKILPKIMQVATDAATKAALGHVEEMLEKRDKRRNLVFVGIPEDQTNRVDQTEADMTLVKNLCRKMSLDSEVIRTTFRDGQKKSNSPRIMKVCFHEGCGQERLSFLRNARSWLLKDNAFSGLRFKPFVRHDLTFKERQRDKTLRDELHARKENGEDLIIRKGQLIPRPSPVPRLMDSEN